MIKKHGAEFRCMDQDRVVFFASTLKGAEEGNLGIAERPFTDRRSDVLAIVRKQSRGKRTQVVDPSLKSFVFTLKNPHDVSPRRFALKAEKKDRAI
jgi:hypothetical protein